MWDPAVRAEYITLYIDLLIWLNIDDTDYHVHHLIADRLKRLRKSAIYLNLAWIMLSFK